MPIRFNCPNCRAQINAPDHLAGQQGKCPKCASPIIVPRPQAPVEDTELQLIPVGAEKKEEPQGPMAAGPAPAIAPGAPGLPPDAPPPLAPYERPKFYTQERRFAWVAPVVKLVIVLIVAGAAFYAYRTFVGSTTPLHLAAHAPQNAAAVFAFTEPKKVVTDTLKSVDDTVADNASAKEEWNKAKAEGREKLGFDFTDPAAYTKAGIDLTQPVTLAVLALEKQQPIGVVASFAVTDEKAALDTVKATAERSQIPVVDVAGDPPLLGMDDFAAGIQNGRLWLLGATTPKQGSVQLRAFFDQRKSTPLADSPSFTATAKALPQGEVYGFVNLPSITQAVPQGTVTKVMGDLLALGFSATQKDAASFLLLSDTAELKKHLVSGATCREFLAQTDKPLAVLTFSLAEPMKLVRYFVESSGGANGLKDFNTGLQQTTKADLDELDSVLKNGAGGLAILPPKIENEFPPILLFLKVNDLEKAIRMLEKSTATPMFERVNVSGKVMFTKQGFLPFSLGMAGDYFVLSPSPDLIKGLVRGDKRGWTPKCGGNELLAGEIFLGDIGRLVAQRLSSLKVFGLDEQAKSVQKSISSDAYAQFGISPKDNGLLVTGKTEGSASATTAAGIFGAIALPGLLRARVSAGEAAAVACCKAFCEAQEIYRRTDYDKDGVLEYAQSLRGNFSLFEKQAGKADLKLITAEFAAAEGEPGAGKPHAGYCFKILKAQGFTAPGGPKSYLEKDNMTLGYALVAYPAAYGASGYNSFLISQTGIVYQKDLGKDTANLVRAMNVFNPDKSWTVAP